MVHLPLAPSFLNLLFSFGECLVHTLPKLIGITLLKQKRKLEKSLSCLGMPEFLSKLSKEKRSSF